jgi:hypothetical protein
VREMKGARVRRGGRRFGELSGALGTGWEIGGVPAGGWEEFGGFLFFEVG